MTITRVKAPCHAEPDPTCDRCSLDILAEVVHMLLKAGGSPYTFEEWAWRRMPTVQRFLEARR